MSLKAILTRQRIGWLARDGYWTGRIITGYLDEAAATTPDKLVGGIS